MIGINPAIPDTETNPNLAKIPKSVIASAAWQSRKKNCHCEGGGIPSRCSEHAWQSLKIKMHLSYEIATLRSQ
jgi:hypothetical protein